MAVSGARVGRPSLLGRLASRALARDLTAFVVPDAATARARGLDLAAAGLRPVATPRHATVLVLVGELPAGLRGAAAVAYAQMPRPRAILAIGTGSIAPLPDPDVAVSAEQAALARGVGELRQFIALGAFSPAPEAFDVGAVRTETTYACPMHPEIVRDGPGKCPICGMNLIPQQEVGRQSGQHEGMAMEPGPGMAHGAMAGVAAEADEHVAEDGFACPMHPEVVGRTPGACPICGMDLVPRAAGSAAGGAGAGHAAHGSAGAFTCPMHPDIARDRPGSCPLCGMDLVPRDAPVAGPTHNPAVDQAAAAAPRDYTCPMHPEVSSDTPGSCPSCGMDLVPRRAPGTPGDNRAEHPTHTVEGDYTCPMHPEVTRDAPGSCPICGMDLMPRGRPNHGTAAPKRGADAHPTSYTCPMHPEIVRDGPGPCPICGMDLVPRGETDGGESTPLHPHSGHRATPEDDPPRPGGAVASGHADHPTAGGDTGADHAVPGDHGSASHGGRATTAAEGAGSMAHGAMGHGRMTATAPQHPAAPAAAHGGAAHAAHAMGGPDDRHDTPSPAAGDMAAMGHSAHGMGETDHADHDTGAHEMGDTGDMDHSMHAMGGFMSMVAMTRDLPRSRDGLPMEWAEVPFGPLSPGLPGGLALALTLDGDVVARATLSEGAVRRGLAATSPGPRETFPDRLARLDPLAPVAYRLLAQRALESAADLTPDAREARARIVALERERAASHLGWLAGFAELLGIGWLAERSAALQLALARAADPDTLAPLRGEAQRLAAGAERLPLLRRRLAAIGRPGEAAERRGPVARAAGVTTDARAADPAYRALGFAPLVREGDDALARLLVRLAEIEQSLDLAIAAGDGAAAAPPRPGTDGGEHGTATLETPRGAATLHLILDAGAVREAHLDAPSGAHAPLIAAVAEGRELADALVGVASLDLSPWELDR